MSQLAAVACTHSPHPVLTCSYSPLWHSATPLMYCCYRDSQSAMIALLEVRKNVRYKHSAQGNKPVFSYSTRRKLTPMPEPKEIQILAESEFIMTHCEGGINGSSGH